MKLLILYFDKIKKKKVKSVSISKVPEIKTVSLENRIWIQSQFSTGF